jgi:hypothetical protein
LHYVDLSVPSQQLREGTSRQAIFILSDSERSVQQDGRTTFCAATSLKAPTGLFRHQYTSGLRSDTHEPFKSLLEESAPSRACTDPGTPAGYPRYSRGNARIGSIAVGRRARIYTASAVTAAIPSESYRYQVITLIIELLPALSPIIVVQRV